MTKALSASCSELFPQAKVVSASCSELFPQTKVQSECFSELFPEAKVQSECFSELFPEAKVLSALFSETFVNELTTAARCFDLMLAVKLRSHRILGRMHGANGPKHLKNAAVRLGDEPMIMGFMRFFPSRS